jgi:hypothetical protein
MSGLSEQQRYELNKIGAAVQHLAGVEDFTARGKGCADQLEEVQPTGLPRDVVIGFKRLRTTLAKFPPASAFEAEYLASELTFRAFDLRDRAMLYVLGQDADMLLGSNDQPDVFDADFEEDAQ